ncbi:MAG: glycosyltransferase [Deltaproteobacteria bacterium]|nr:glycosyltransferase [Deltaproteobacteria bacterium]
MTTPETIDVVVRCRNEMPHTARTLEALAAQKGLRVRVLFLDCRSTDGSRESAVRAGVQVHDIEPSEYVPGTVLNLGMRMTQSPVVAFVNADAVPLSPEALLGLLLPLSQPDVAATFARQVARPEADAMTRLDYARAFGSVPPPMAHGVFFSMAASALRRDAWDALPFDEKLRFSEDADWTRRAAAVGWRAVYVPEARFEHSHDYDLAGQLKRRRGEGVADTHIFRLGKPSPVKELLRPLAGALVRDLKAGVLGPRPMLVRTTQVVGRFTGRLLARSSAERDGSRLNLRQERLDRWTLSQDPAAEAGVGAAIANSVTLIREAMGTALESLALVGSYARGEGGVQLRGGAPGPSNDLDFVAVVPGNVRAWRKKLELLSLEWSMRIGVHVEVWAVGRKFLRRVPPTLFWLDVAQGGHRVLHGDARAFALPIEPRMVPLDEAGRLLANRAVGLALSNIEGGEGTMIRHAHKMVLACGDALLLAADRYVTTMRGRAKELERLAVAPSIGPELVRRYAEAVAWRASKGDWVPRGQTVDAWYADVRQDAKRWHLAFERFRAGAPAEVLAFVRSRKRVYQALPDVRPLGAMLAALRAAVKREASLFPVLGHPRERLARVAVALAYAPHDPGARAEACALLGLPEKATKSELTARLRLLAARAG